MAVPPYDEVTSCLQPKDAEAKTGLAIVLISLNQTNEAISLLESAVKDDPTNSVAQSDFRLHIGLGDSRQVDKLEISGPSGATEVVKTLDADRSYCVKEGAGVVPCVAIRPTALK